MPTPDPRTIPSFSSHFWTDEVGLAGGEPPEPPAYTFSNGRKFAAIKYDPPVPPPQNP